MQQESDFEKLYDMNKHIGLNQAIVKRYYDFADDLVDTIDKDDIIQTEDGVYQFIRRSVGCDIYAYLLRFDYIKQVYYNTHTEKILKLVDVAKYDDRNNILYSDSSKGVYYKFGNELRFCDGIGASWSHNEIELENGDLVKCDAIQFTDKILDEKIKAIANYGSFFVTNYALTENIENICYKENKGFWIAIKHAFIRCPEMKFIDNKDGSAILELSFRGQDFDLELILFLEVERFEQFNRFIFNGNYELNKK